MKTGDLVRQFGVSDATIRRWSKEFSQFLSPGANKVGSLQASFNESDYAVLATVHRLSGEGHSLDQIREKLASGYLIDVDNISNLGYDDGRMVPAAVVEQVIDAAQLRAELIATQMERDRLLQTVDRQNETIQAQQEKIERLQRELGKMEGRLEQIEKDQ